MALHLIGKGHKEAILPVPHSVIAALLPIHDLRKADYLFPGRSDGHIITRTAAFWMTAAAKRANLAKAKGHVHALRHSFATHLLWEGANLRDVQDLMRHSNLSTTGRYLHTNPSRLRSVIDLLS